MKKLLRTLILAAMMLPFVSNAQLNAIYQFSTGVDNTRWYTLTEDSTMLLDASSFTTSTSATTGDSKKTEVTNIGFSFYFAGTNYTQFSVNSDGTVKLGETQIGTSNYTTPFSASNAGVNAPKICGLGCDGCMVLGDYIAYQVFGSEGSRVAVIEISTGTYTTATRANHYTFQVQFSEADSSVTLIYSPTAPAAGPGAAYQLGASSGANDIVLFNVATSSMTPLTSGTATNNASGTWPAPGRYYTITPDVNACLPVTNLTVSDITSTTATLSWEGQGIGYTLYEYGNFDSAAFMYTDTFAVLNTLLPNTSYTFGVTATCANDNESNMMTVSFRTECEALSLPWTCGFEAEEIQSTTAATALPWCSNRYVSPEATSGTTYPYSYSSSTYAHGGSRSLYFYGITSSSYPEVMAFILPEINVNSYPMNGNRLSFWGRSSSTSYDKKVYVYTMTDRADMSTLTLIDSAVVTGTTHSLYTIALTNAPANDANLVLVVMRGSGSLYLDDMTLEVMPSCIEVSNINASATSNSVDLTWNDNTNAAGTTYTIYNMEPSTPAVIASNVTGTTYTVNNLTSNTNYTFGIQANCTSGDATIMTVSTRTACEAFEAPYTWTFEDQTSGTPYCWTKIGSGTAAVNNSTSYSHSGSMSLKFSGATTNVIALPETDDEISTLQLRFWTRPESFTSSSCGTFSVGYVTDVTDATTFVVLDTYTYSDFSAIVEKTVTFAGAPTGARIAMRHNPTSTAWYWFVDDVTIEEAPNCLPVTGLTADNITDDGATLTWTGNASSYNVYIVSDIDTTFYQNVTTNSIVLTGLLASTQYTFGVAADCGNDESDTVYVTFNTACTAIALPFTEDFESTSNTVACWTTDGPGTWSIGTGDYSASTGAYSGSLNAKIQHSSSGNVTKLISPVLDNVTDGIVLDFAHIQRSWSGDQDELRVYYRAHIDSAWHQVVEYTTEFSTWTVESVTIPGEVYQVAFEMTDGYGYGVAIDSVVFTEMSGSFCYPVSDLTVDSVTATSVFLSWSDDNNSGVTYSIYNSNGNVEATGVTTTYYEVTGLTASTNYTFGVVANCSATESSNAVTVSARTDCAGGSCQITIVGTDSYGDGWNNGTLYFVQNGEMVGYFTISSGSTLTETYNVCGGAPVFFGWIPGQYDDEVSFQIIDGSGAVVCTIADASTITGDTVYAMYTPCPSCGMPSVTVDATTETSITISWTGSASSYNVYNGTTFVANVTTNTYTFTGLTATTTYTLGVQALCSDSDSSDIATVVAMTSCSGTALNLPFIENFADSSNTRNCWTTIDADGDGHGWSYIYQGMDQELMISESYDNSTYMALTPDNWLVSPLLHTTANNDITMTWNVGAADDDYYAEHYGVYVSTTGNTDTSDFTLLNQWTLTSASGQVMNLDLSAYAGQDIYVAFRHFNCTDQFLLLIDDVEITTGAYVPDSMKVTINVNDVTMGTTNPAPGIHYFVEGENASVIAMPYEGYHLEGWTINITVPGYGTVMDTTFNWAMDDVFDIFGGWLVEAGDGAYEWSVTANFAAGDPIVPNDSLTVITSVNNANWGTALPAVGTHYFVEDDVFILGAIPAEGYYISAIYEYVTMPGYGTFADTMYTEGTELEQGAPLLDTIEVDGEMIGMVMNFHFVFAPIGQNPTYNVTIAVNDPTMGTTDPAPGVYAYEYGEVVTITAIANEGYHFVSWSNGVTTNTISGVVTEDITLTATFAPDQEGIDDADGININAYGKDGNIVLQGAEGREVYVFDINGRMLHHTATATMTETYGIPVTGVYLIKVEGIGTKRIVIVR